jgi:hypothetical protein
MTITPEQKLEYIRTNYSNAPKPFIDWFIASNLSIRCLHTARLGWMAAMSEASSIVRKIPGSQVALFKIAEIS